ncbi:MAG: class II aldolase/adducin family protein, partial [Planctomycetota bacterium]
MELHKKHEREVEAFVRVCHGLASNMYVTAHGGNLAWKIADDLIIITPTCRNKGDVGAEDVVFIDGSGQVVEGRHAPTGEK